MTTRTTGRQMQRGMGMSIEKEGSESSDWMRSHSQKIGE